MNEAEDFFLRECAAHARSLPVQQAILYLRGLLVSCEDSPALAPIRRIYDSLMSCESQLELIHSGQMKLRFGQDNPDGNGEGESK